MDKEKRLKMLLELEEWYHKAKVNPDINPYTIRQLYFELQCLRYQLLSMDEEEVLLE